MDIRLNAPVECLDGKHGGYVTGIVVNPATDEFTHLVVKTEGVERIVSAALIRDADPEGVRLSCTLARLHEQQPLVETEYVRSPIERFDFTPGLVFPDVEPRFQTETRTVRHEHLPSGDLEIKRGMAVFAQDGRVGRVDDVVVDPVSDRMTHIVLREGHLWGADEITVGIEHVKSIADDGIHLDCTKAQVPRLQSSPATPSPAAAQGDTTLDIAIDAAVHCTDGDFGSVTCLIVNPVNDTVTHFVVKEHGLIGIEHIVPVSFIDGATADRVTVNCDRATLAQQPNFLEYEYDRFEDLTPGREGYLYWPMMLADDLSAPPYLAVAHEQIPANELAARRGMAVYAVENEGGEKAGRIRIGRVEAFVADRATGHITHLVLREGHLWGQRDITIPVSAIGKIASGEVDLTLTKQAVEALPAVPVKHWTSLIK